MRLLALLAASAAWAQTPRVSILQFVAPQCPACDAAAGQVKQLQARYGAAMTVIVKDASQSPDEARALGVGKLPLLFVNGRRLDGPLDLPSLTRVIDLVLGKLVADSSVQLTLDTAPRLGKAGVPEITVFSDFQCPFCSTLAPVLSELAHQGEAAIRFKHFPLSFHAKAPAAHRAAWAAGQQGKFWEMHDRIFAHPSRLDPNAYTEYAQAIGLDLSRFAKDSAADPAIFQADLAEGERVGVEGTPSVFIDGRAFLGRPTLENLRLALKSVDRQPATPPVDIQPTILSGGPHSPVTLEWFFDAHSDLTRPSAVAVRDLLNHRNVQVIARHLPMPFHPGSRTTHQALVLAARQGKFWSFLDAVLSQPSGPDTERLKSLAMRVGLDAAGFFSALDSGAAAPAVESDLRRAQTLSVRGVPTFVLNGKPLDGAPDAASLRAAIAPLAAPAKLALTGGLATQ
jgi:protein-disulfide isomerase